MSPISPNLFILLTICNSIAALPTILPNPHLQRRAAEPVQPCGYNEMWPYGVMQTSQAECNAAAGQMCSLIPSAGWSVNDWTKIDVGSCRAMVYHTNNMHVPTVDDCMQTFAGIIATCIVQQPGKNDDGSANRNEEDPSKVEEDKSMTVYQIGSGAYYDKKFELNVAWLAGSTSNIAMTNHAR
ncbi:MAG: hypothetical protein L6R39_005934 [Caloplaca ligustica]|nr:MAG: hypothetical protein L6R39_005934 [Caloplaca ligustica]